MRESFGGAFMIKLILIFIVVYISFMAVAINYAKAFRVKNNVINLLEQNQFKLGDEITFIDKYLDSVPYNFYDNRSVQDNCNNVTFGSTDNEKKTVLTLNGACIVKMGDEDENSRDYYYKVTTYISIEFPFFNIYMTFPISGETKIIY